MKTEQSFGGSNVPEPKKNSLAWEDSFTEKLEDLRKELLHKELEPKNQTITGDRWPKAPDPLVEAMNELRMAVIKSWSEVISKGLDKLIKASEPTPRPEFKAGGHAILVKEKGPEKIIDSAGRVHFTPKPGEPSLEKTEATYDWINPNHYKNFSTETIDMMVAIWGKEATALHCEMTAFKYKMRVGSKPGQSVEKDLEKSNWYLNKAKQLRDEQK